MNPILINLEMFQIGWYPVLIMIGVLIATILITTESNKYQINKEFVTNLIFWCVLFGIIGARAYYVLFNLDYYSQHLNETYRIWEGGLAIHGGIILAVLFMIMYCKKYKVRVLKVTDIFAVGLIVAQMIGRWGNFFNQEAHGPATTRLVLEQVKLIPKFVIDGMNILGTYYHPTFYYESVWCLFGFIILILLRAYYKYLKIGQLTAVYLIWYGIGRLFIEGLRTDSLMFNELKVAQIVSIIAILVGIILLIIRTKGSKFENRYKEVEVSGIRF